MSKEMLKENYSNYVQECGDKPRYNEETKAAMERFYDLALTFTGTGEADELYDSMIEIAVAFEESGFNAGFIRGQQA